jgi:hypothetical protein
MKGEETSGGRFNYILNMCHNCDFEKLLQGIHENYLNIKFRDTNFVLASKASDWFIYTDKLAKLVRDSKYTSFKK